ncbi:MAG: 30S ribosomal protein S2 [Candidatus Kaiserbacteria bacterium]|nr:30S ribosomal protein S2 [Candidatus Kaiserbacteria bacterium]MCB9816253.1 30S ribosomal protein S2 [Candidatus Nomurabacteria bacterium]
MSTTSIIDKLFEAGSHFGFKKSRRHPSVAKYVFATKDGSDIIDLEKTTALLETAKETLKEAGSHGKIVLFVSTKDEAAKIVTAAAEKTESPYVTNRWIGGMLTNWSEIKKRINRLEALMHEKESGELERKYTKKERVVLGREIDKLSFNFAGIAKMPKLPDLMVVVDPRHDEIAINEAREKNIPVIALMSSDCDARKITYPVVANDSLQSSVSLLVHELVDAYAEGKATYVPKPADSRPRGGDRRRPA